MRLVDDLRSFRRRRILIPVGPDDVVLDVGSGDKPHWRADVLLDRYAGAEHGGQRSGAAAARVPRPLFDADAAAMPFTDKAFGYVVCSHVLEHVVDPGAVIEEMMRVAKAGYIEVPEAASAKIVDFPSHLWWCRLDGDTLAFTAKTTPYFDAEIDHYLHASGLRDSVAALLDRHLEQRVVSLCWEGTIRYRVEGTPSPALLEAAHGAGGGHRTASTVASRLATAVFAAPERHRRRRQPLMLGDVVELPHGATNEVLAARVYRPPFGTERFDT